MNDLLVKQLEEILDCKEDISALANTTALLYDYFDNLNWLGFYFVKGDKLILGPFQGKVACTEIQIGKGVCGTAVQEKRTLRVPDVHAFKGHIACDSASNSEIVLPIIVNDKVIGVLDIDSPIFDRFSLEDEMLLESLVKVLEDRFKDFQL